MHGVGVVVSAGALVEVRGPGVGGSGVGAFDPDCGDLGGEERAHEGAQPERVMGDGEPGGLLAVGSTIATA